MIKDEIARMWVMMKVIVIPVVVGALGAIATGFEKYVVAIGIDMKVEHALKTALLGKARILRLVIEHINNNNNKNNNPGVKFIC